MRILNPASRIGHSLPVPRRTRGRGEEKSELVAADSAVRLES